MLCMEAPPSRSSTTKESKETERGFDAKQEKLKSTNGKVNDPQLAGLEGLTATVRKYVISVLRRKKEKKGVRSSLVL